MQSSYLFVEFVQHFLDLYVVQKRVIICLCCDEALVVGDHARKGKIRLLAFTNSVIYLV